MRAAKGAAVAFASVLILLSTRASAHRLDEYLQAARIAVQRNRVEIELDLTPGAAVAEAAIADLDCDRDGLVSAVEQTAYVRDVVRSLAVAFDGRLLRLDAVDSTFPEPPAFRRGEATIQLRLASVLPSVSDGVHQLVFRNAYRPDMSAYLANALMPASEAVVIDAQRRDPEQRTLTIDYTVGAGGAASGMLWPLGIGSLVVCVAALAMSRRYGTHSC